MSYSIFEDTMTDMNYQEIENAAKEQAIVLFPIGVIEEHGPHLCLGTDVYLIYNTCKGVQARLQKEGISALIAPPFYWGVNNVTGDFAGSFTVRRSTMKAVLIDTLLCLKRWGFEKIFLFNFHGDYQHNITIHDAVKDARIDYGVRAYAVLDEFMAKRYGFNGQEEHIAIYKTETDRDKNPAYIDVHAGTVETSLMFKNFPELVDVELAKSLKPSKSHREYGRKWCRGWSDAREVTPSGYFGDPSAIDIELAKKIDDNDVGSIVKLLLTL